MTWTAPMTAVANATFFAAEFNTHIRDNLNETEVAKANIPHSIIGVTNTQHVIKENKVTHASALFGASTSSTSYVELQGGPAAEITLEGVSGVIIATTASVACQSQTAIAYMSYQVTGVNNGLTQIASDGQALKFSPAIDNGACQFSKIVAYTSVSIATSPDTYTITAFYKSSSGASVASFTNRHLLIIPF